MKIDDLSAKLKRVQKLLDDPHPGLFTWHRAVARAMEDLIKDWNEE